MIDSIFLIIGSIGLIIGSITDFQKREVADYLNYFLIFTGLFLRLLGAIEFSDIWYFLIPLFWVLVSYIFGLFMYYSGQWGGGDVKMLIGLCALFGTTNFPGLENDLLQTMILSFLNQILPFTLSFSYQVTFFIHFIFHSFFIGALYSLVWTFGLVIIHFSVFKKTYFSKLLSIKYISLFSLFLILIGLYFLLFYQSTITLSYLLITFIGLTPFILLYVRTIEEVCMVRNMSLSELTEGEWVIENIFVKKKTKSFFEEYIKKFDNNFIEEKNTLENTLKNISLKNKELCAFESKTLNILLKTILLIKTKYYSFNVSSLKKKITMLEKDFLLKKVHLSKKIKSTFVSYLLQKGNFSFAMRIRKVSPDSFLRILKEDDFFRKNEQVLLDTFLEEAYLFKKNHSYITGPKDLGISNDTIKLLRKNEHIYNIHSLRIKVGIPFVPAFLLAFVATYFFGNLIYVFLSFL